VIVVAHEHTAVLEAFDVLAGNAYMNPAEFHLCTLFANFNSLSNSAYRLFNIRHYSAQHAGTFYLANADDFKSPVCSSPPGKTTDLGRANIEGYNDIMGLWD
jgi:hypothetical protein